MRADKTLVDLFEVGVAAITVLVELDDILDRVGILLSGISPPVLLLPVAPLPVAPPLETPLLVAPPPKTPLPVAPPLELPPPVSPLPVAPPVCSEEEVEDEEPAVSSRGWWKSHVSIISTFTFCDASSSLSSGISGFTASSASGEDSGIIGAVELKDIILLNGTI